MPSPGYEPWAGVDANRRRIMQSNRSRDTRPEMRVRSMLHARGLRFRVSPLVLLNGRRVRPDVAFTKWKVAVFIDGCFWHACPQHGTKPKSNTDYWLPKLAQNQARDRLNDGLLSGAGWTVVRCWEHDDPDEIATRIETAVRAAQARSPSSSRSRI